MFGLVFDYWFDSRGIQKNFNDLREFLITDQLLSTVPIPVRLHIPIPVRLHIKEQDKHLLGDIGVIADSWTAAHRAYPRSGHRMPYTAENQSSPRPSCQGSSKPTGQSDGNKTSDSAGR